MAALAIASTWFKAFYWMRLFEETAFFINLLTKTFEGIKAFTVMMIILIMAIGNVMFVLNLKDKDTLGIDDSLYTIHLPYEFANAMIFAYNLALGDYDTGNFTGEH